MRADAHRALTVDQIAAELAVSPGKVTGWIKAGVLRAIDVSKARAVKPRYRIRPADYEAFLASRAAIPTEEEKPPRQPRRQAGEKVIEYV